MLRDTLLVFEARYLPGAFEDFGRGMLIAIYLSALTGLALYALHSMVLLGLYLWHRRTCVPERPLPSDEHLPVVTVQIPLRNERYVARSILAAVAELRWPRERLQIQVLDDSDDDTFQIVEEEAARLRQSGYWIEVLHRPVPCGAKAGALANGLLHARGEYLAIFDADCRPAADFLVRTIPHLLAQSDVGAVQARWGYLNAGDSMLTRAQALLLDVHFSIDHIARNRSGLLMNFNGTAGVWRRQAIEMAGGWQSDTLCEDLDLSYRAQIDGWRMLYLSDVVVLTELPSTLGAFKQQQRRWAKGAVQTLRKLAWSIVASTRLCFVQKVMALLHLSGYANPVLLLVVLGCIPALVMLRPVLPYWEAYLRSLLALPMLLVPVAQMGRYRDWPRRLLAYPALVFIGAGLSCSLLLGVWEGMTHRGGVFLRTPKVPKGVREGAVGVLYRTPNPLLLSELTLFLSTLGVLVLLWYTRRFVYLWLDLLYLLGSGWMLANSVYVAMRAGDVRDQMQA